jgi:hypothetical protein
MDENLALQEKANQGDPLSFEVLHTMHSEAQQRIEIEAIAQSQLPMNCNDFQMQEDVQVDMEDRHRWVTPNQHWKIWLWIMLQPL